MRRFLLHYENNDHSVQENVYLAIAMTFLNVSLNNCILAISKAKDHTKWIAFVSIYSIVKNIFYRKIEIDESIDNIVIEENALEF